MLTTVGKRKEWPDREPNPGLPQFMMGAITGELPRQVVEK